MLRSTSIKSLRPLCIAIALAALAAIPAAGATTGLLTFVEAEFNDPGLDGAASVAVSPDGNHVYVASPVDDAVSAFARDASLGTLTLVDTERDDVNGVDGLAGADSVAISPDGSSVYVASWVEDAVAVFERDALTGLLTFSQVVKDTDIGIDGLDSANSVAVSADGGHVYVAGREDDAVAVFERHPPTGTLTLVEIQWDDTGDVDGLDGAIWVAISPDDQYVYVAGQIESAVAVFERDSSSGELTFVQVVKETDPGVDGLFDVDCIAVSPDGNNVYAAAGVGTGDDAVAVFSRSAFTGGLTFVEVEQDGVGEVDGLDGARSVAVSPDGNHVYVTGYHDNAVAVFDRDGTTGELGFAGAHFHGDWGCLIVDGLMGPSGVVASPDGAHVYVADSIDDAVGIFGRDAATGGLSFVSSNEDLDALDGARAAAVSPDGANVYVASRENDAVVVFGRNDAGMMNFVQARWDGTGVWGAEGLDGANGVAVSPDGQNVYVASVYDDAVVAFNRSASFGSLGPSQVISDGMPLVDGLNFATSVAVSPDGRHVYATAAIDDAVTAFSRYTPTGQLIYLDNVKDGDNSGSVDGLDGAYSVAISPDGYHAYVAGADDDALAAFVRNPDGYLTFIQVVSDTGSLVNGLDSARSVSVSPDGEHVYVASYNADTLAVYDRNPASGQLTFSEIHQDGAGGVSGLDGAHAVVVSPDGLRVYVAGAQDDALTVFHRDPASGQLTLGEEHRDNVGGVQGLEGPVSIALSPSGSHIYVASFVDDAVAAFRRNLYAYLPLVMRGY